MSTSQLVNSSANQSAPLNFGIIFHAISSSIKAASSQFVYTDARLNITGNAAERGGGLSLEANAKLYILKYESDRDIIVRFTANSADYGGAIHVDDDTNSVICASNTETECFFQVLALHNLEYPDLSTQSMYFSQNHANIIAGSTLYGGLLDRCAVSPFAEVHNKYSRDLTTACQPVHPLTSASKMELMLSVPSIGHFTCVDLANLVSAFLLAVHTASHVLATGLH